MRLAGQVAIITGASQGIGAATARKLASEGACVALNDVLMTGADGLVAEFEADGGEAIAVEADISQRQQVEAMVRQVLQEYGRIDILINNAGVFRKRALLEITDQDWDQVLDVNLKGAFLCAQAVAPHMMEQQHGKIVNVASGAAYGAATPGSLSYSAAKAGVLGLTFTLAMELGPSHINVNVVVPGDIDTEMNRAVAEQQGIDFDAYKREQAKTIPIRRFGRPEDVADVISFLVSDEARHVNGEVVHIFGGPPKHG